MSWLKTNAAGSGPFSLKSWKPNESLVLEANESYWDGAPKIKRVLIKNVTESATQQLLVQKGDIDIARNLTGDQLKRCRAQRRSSSVLRRRRRSGTWAST